MNKYFIFEEWLDYEAGGMRVNVFNKKKEVMDYINREIEGKTLEEGKQFVDRITIIYGTKLAPGIEEVTVRASVIL
jgi:hypothetical protein